MEQVTDSIEVPVGLRTQEKDQLETFVPNIIDYLDGLGLDDSAGELRDVTITYEPNEESRFRHLASTTADEWRTLISSLSNESSIRAWWLRKKLAVRFYRKLEELKEAMDDGTRG